MPDPCFWRPERQRSRRPFDYALTPTISTPSAARARRRPPPRRQTYRLPPQARYRYEPSRLSSRQPAPHASGASRQPESAARGHVHALCDGRRPEHALFNEQRVGSSRQPKTSNHTCGGTRPIAPPSCAIRASGTTSCARVSAVWHRAAAARVDDCAEARHVADQPGGRRQGTARRRSSRYGSRFSAAAPATIAVVPAGYADGLDLRLEGTARC